MTFINEEGRFYDRDRGIDMKVIQSGPEGIAVFKLATSEWTYEFTAQSRCAHLGDSEPGPDETPLVWKVFGKDHCIPAMSSAETKKLIRYCLQSFKYGYGDPKDQEVLVDQ